MRRFLAQALWVVALAAPMLTPTLAAASPPDLDVAEQAAGEWSGEVNAFVGHNAWTVRPELEFGLSNALGLEIQADVVNARGGATALSNVSAQLMMALSANRSFGIAVEVGYDPGEETTGGEVFLFAGRSAGPWAGSVNAGLQREDGNTAAVYAWRIERELASDWSLGVEGGGEIPFHGGGREHLIGPTLGARVGSLELRLSWLNGMGADNLARIGLERAF